MTYNINNLISLLLFFVIVLLSCTKRNDTFEDKRENKWIDIEFYEITPNSFLKWFPNADANYLREEDLWKPVGIRIGNVSKDDTIIIRRRVDGMFPMDTVMVWVRDTFTNVGEYSAYSFNVIDDHMIIESIPPGFSSNVWAQLFINGYTDTARVKFGLRAEVDGIEKNIECKSEFVRDVANKEVMNQTMISNRVIEPRRMNRKPRKHEIRK